MTTVGALLAAARHHLGGAEARLLLGHVLRQSAAWLLANDDVVISEAQRDRFAMLVARRRGGEPIAYLTGSREFYGRDFAVAPGVLIPRPETELLVDIVKAKVSPGGTARMPFRILDLGTGSGCVAISIALECPGCEVVAVERSVVALEIARANAARLAARLEFAPGDWFAGVAGRRFDLIISNPPYVRDADPHLARGDLRFEPRDALASGTDGLEAIRHLIAAAGAFLSSGGWLFLEHGHDQAAEVLVLLESSGFSGIEQHRDLADIVRVTGGQFGQHTVSGANS